MAICLPPSSMASYTAFYWVASYYKSNQNSCRTGISLPSEQISEMEIFTPALLVLLCLSTLCIMSAAGSYNHGHPLLTPSHGQSNNIHKRHIEVNQLRECQRIISQEQCNNGLLQEAVNLSLQCNLPAAATIIRDRCRRNSAGDYCALAEKYTVNDIGTIVGERSMIPLLSVLHDAKTCSR